MLLLSWLARRSPQFKPGIQTEAGKDDWTFLRQGAVCKGLVNSRGVAVPGWRPDGEDADDVSGSVSGSVSFWNRLVAFVNHPNVERSLFVILFPK